jgi:hypothetical protein
VARSVRNKIANDDSLRFEALCGLKQTFPGVREVPKAKKSFAGTPFNVLMALILRQGLSPGLMLAFDSASVSGLLNPVAANCHAAPSASSPRAIDEHESAGWPFAIFDIREVFAAY